MLDHVNALLSEEEQNFLEVSFKIRPAFFEMSHFNEKDLDEYFADWEGNKATSLKNATGQRDRTFFEDIAKGYPATYETMLKVQTCIRKELGLTHLAKNIRALRFRSIKDRGISGIKMTPSLNERVH